MTAQKAEMISKIDNGASRMQMCLDYCIGETTVENILAGMLADASEIF